MSAWLCVTSSLIDKPQRRGDQAVPAAVTAPGALAASTMAGASRISAGSFSVCAVKGAKSCAGCGSPQRSDCSYRGPIWAGSRTGPRLCPSRARGSRRRRGRRCGGRPPSGRRGRRDVANPAAWCRTERWLGSPVEDVEDVAADVAAAGEDEARARSAWSSIACTVPVAYVAERRGRAVPRYSRLYLMSDLGVKRS